MYVARVPNRNSPPAYLLREGWREGGKVKTRTLANLSHWPLRKIEALRRVLADDPQVRDRRAVWQRPSRRARAERSRARTSRATRTGATAPSRR